MTTNCSHEDCVRPAVGRGLCRKHYNAWDQAAHPERWRRYRTRYQQTHRNRIAERERAYRASNRARLNAKKRDNYRQNRDELVAKARARNIRRKYGMGVAEYDAIIAKGCVICGTHEGQICLDHDHTTGKVRDALCASCNNGLGRFADSPVRLRAAAAYLETHAVEAAA